MCGKEILGCLSPAQLHFIPLSDLPKCTIDEIFAYDLGKKEEIIEAKIRFASFPPHEVYMALKKELLGEWTLRLLSPEQLSGIKFSELPEKTIGNIFFKSFNKEENAATIKNLSYISKEEIKACHEAGNLPPHVINLLKRL